MNIRKNIGYLIYGLLGFALVSCSKEAESQIIPSKPIYLGAYYVADILAPFPKLLTFEGDTAILIDNKGIPQDTAVLVDSMLLFKEMNLFVYRKTIDQLTVMHPGYRNQEKSYTDNIVFRNVTNKSKKYSGNIHEIVAGKVWNYKARYLTPNEDMVIQHQLHFKGDTLYHYRYYHYNNTLLYSEFEQYQFNLFELEGHFFLSLIDSKSTSENPLPIYEIMEFNAGEIKWLNHNALAPELETLTLADKSLQEIEEEQEQAIPFRVCYEAEQTLYYYGGGNYKDGAAGFLRDYQQLAQNKNLGTREENGYIIFQFKVNCENKLGRYGLIQMDMDFQPTQFNTNLVQSLFTIVNNSSLKWELPLEGIGYCHTGQIKDLKSFVMFKIQKGEVTEVLP